MSVDVREHVCNLINALTNLSPSRNLIPQLILLLPKTSSIVERSYPELASSEAKSLLTRHFGVEFGDIVKTTFNSFSEALYKQIHKIFDQLADEGVRSSLAKLSNVAVSSIPNPYAEWVKLVLKKLSTRPDGGKIVEFLRMLLERSPFLVYREGYSSRAAPPNWQPFLEEAGERIKANPAEFEEILRLTVSMLGAVGGYGDDIVSRETSRDSERTIYRMHSEYHLDLISAEHNYVSGYSSYWVDITYNIRHKDLVKAALEEVVR